MYEHRIVKCKEKKSKIAKTCEKMGMDGWEFAGQFRSRVLLQPQLSDLYPQFQIEAYHDDTA